MPLEEFPRKESGFEKISKSKELEGWHFMGREGLTQTKFSKEAKFEEIPHQTEDEIKKRYLEFVKEQDPSSDFEIELMLDENTDKLRKLRKISTDEEYRNTLENLNPEDKHYLVWMRRIEK
jgi:hypothetical protein